MWLIFTPQVCTFIDDNIAEDMYILWCNCRHTLYTQGQAPRNIQQYSEFLHNQALTGLENVLASDETTTNFKHTHFFSESSQLLNSSMLGHLTRYLSNVYEHLQLPDLLQVCCTLSILTTLMLPCPNSYSVLRMRAVNPMRAVEVSVHVWLHT